MTPRRHPRRSSATQTTRSDRVTATDSAQAALFGTGLASTTNVSWVGTGANAVRVHVVRPAVGEAYIQTVADGQRANNLLSLPRY